MEDPDIGFSYDKDTVKSARKPYEVEFQVLSPADIQAHQNKQIEDVSAILGLPPEDTAILLRYTKWNKEKLIESYMDQPEELLEEAGLGSNFSEPPKTKTVSGFTCDICYEDSLGLVTYAMRCGHRYCVDCYKHYLLQKIKEEGEAARVQCPRDGCHRIVDSKTLELLLPKELQDRYVSKSHPDFCC